MKRFMMKYAHVLSVFAFVLTVAASNRTCCNILHEAKLPESAKHLRKF